jgi:sugar/nucleoside kinase (ribokinase family)
MGATQPVGLFVGLTTVDVIQLVERLPEPDEKVAALDQMVSAGGPAANAAVAFAALGGRAVLLTRIGADPAGAIARDDLAARGVDVRDLDTTAPTTVASIMVTASTGQRAVVSATDRGRSTVAADPSPLGHGLPAGPRPAVVLIDSYEVDAGLAVARWARTAGVPVLLDCGGKKPQTDRQLPLVDAAVVSQTYLSGGPGAIAASIRSAGVPFGAITAGADPIRFWTPAGPGTLDVAAVPVVDTLGAGDFFHGALAWFVARHGRRAESFADGLDFATRVAGRSVRSFGTRAWLADVPGATGVRV